MCGYAAVVAALFLEEHAEERVVQGDVLAEVDLVVLAAAKDVLGIGLGLHGCC